MKQPIGCWTSDLEKTIGAVHLTAPILFSGWYQSILNIHYDHMHNIFGNLR
jgi:hypothetical protein